MAVNHECPNLASLPDEVKKLQQMNDKLFAQMQGCDLRRLGESTFRNGCLSRSDSQSTPVSPDSLITQTGKPAGTGDSKPGLTHSLVPNATSTAGPSPNKSDDLATGHTARTGTNISPPAFINPLDYSTHTRLADPTCPMPNRVSPAMKSGSSCTSYIGSFSSSSSPSPSLPDTAPFHAEQQSAWKTRPGGSPFYPAKRPCTQPPDYASSLFRKTTAELPPHGGSISADKVPMKRRGRLRKDAFPTKAGLLDATSDTGLNSASLNEVPTRTQTGGTKKLTDSLKTSIKRHMPGPLGVNNSTRGTVSTAAYKYLTWREKDRRRRFREEWKHLWLVIPHGRYEVMCLVCHKVMTQRKLDTIKRHTVRRHVELLGMPEIDRQNLFEQLIRQHNLLNTVDSTTVSNATSTRISRKTPENSKVAHEKQGSENASSEFRHMSTSRTGDHSGWQPDLIMSQISSLAAVQSNSAAVAGSRNTTSGGLSNRTGLGSHPDLPLPPSGLENGPIPSVLSAMTHCADPAAFGSHMFKRAFEELFADSHKSSAAAAGTTNTTSTTTNSAATSTTSPGTINNTTTPIPTPITAIPTTLKDSNRSTMMSMSPNHPSNPAFPGSMPFPSPLSPNTIQKTVLNYSNANSGTSSFTQLLEQLANSRGKIPPLDSGTIPASARSQIATLGSGKFTACDSTSRCLDPLAESSTGTSTNSGHADNHAGSRIGALGSGTTRSDANTVGCGRPSMTCGSEHRTGSTSGESVPESASNVTMAAAAAAAAATAQSLLRIPPHLWPHSFPGGLSNKPPEINPMMMATWAAAAVAAAAASGSGTPSMDNVSMAAAQFSKFQEAQLMPNPLRLPYNTNTFPLHQMQPPNANKFPPTRGPGPSDLRHLPPFGPPIPTADTGHSKYPDPCARLPLGKSMHNHVAPLDFTKLAHPWNWAFGLPPTNVMPRPPQPDSRSASHPSKQKSDGPGGTRPSDFPTTRIGDKNGTANHSNETSPSGTAPCLVCTWEQKKREGILSESDARFVGLEYMPHSCRSSALNTNVAAATGRQKTSISEKSDPAPGSSWPLSPPEAGFYSRQASHPVHRSYPSTIYDPGTNMSDFMKSVPPWSATSFRPAFGPTANSLAQGSFDPCMMFYCTELLRQHCRASSDRISPGSLDRPWASATSPARPRPSSRSGAVSSTATTTTTTAVNTKTTATSGSSTSVTKSDSGYRHSPARENQSDQCPDGNADSNETTERGSQEIPRARSTQLASSPRPAPTPASVGVCASAEPTISPGLQFNTRDCLSPIWWINLTQPSESKFSGVGSEQTTSIGSTSDAPGPLSMHMLRLAPGQDLRSCLSHYVTSRQLGGAFVVTCCGSVERARLRLANLDIKEFYGPFEIVSLVGTLAFDGQPHLHIALADSNGAVVGGHLLGPSRIHTTAELVLGAVSCGQSRTGNEDANATRPGLKRPASSGSAYSSSVQASPSAGPESEPMDVTASAERSPTKSSRTESPPAESRLRIRLVRKADPVTGFKELTIESTENF